MEKQGVSREIAELHERECKRYLLLCAMFPTEGLGMQGPVDEYWHTFLMFTKEYKSFCEEIAGFFIHHVPTVDKSKNSGSNNFQRTMQKYIAVFGETPDERAWPRFKLASGTNSDCTCEVGGANDPGGPETACEAASPCNGDQ